VDKVSQPLFQVTKPRTLALLATPRMLRLPCIALLHRTLRATKFFTARFAR
jgi:hypothetical protein